MNGFIWSIRPEYSGLVNSFNRFAIRAADQQRQYAVRNGTAIIAIQGILLKVVPVW